MSDTNLVVPNTISPEKKTAPMAEIFTGRKQENPAIVVNFVMAQYFMEQERQIQQAENAKLAPEEIFPQVVMKHQETIFTISQIHDISTHPLAIFLLLHLDEINPIIESAELLKVAEAVAEHKQASEGNPLAEAESILFYFCKRNSINYSQLEDDQRQAIWSKIYTLFEQTKQVEQIIPDWAAIMPMALANVA